MASSIRIGLLR